MEDEITESTSVFSDRDAWSDISPEKDGKGKGDEKSPGSHEELKPASLSDSPVEREEADEPTVENDRVVALQAMENSERGLPLTPQRPIPASSNISNKAWRDPHSLLAAKHASHADDDDSDDESERSVLGKLAGSKFLSTSAPTSRRLERQPHPGIRPRAPHRTPTTVVPSTSGKERGAPRMKKSSAQGSEREAAGIRQSARSDSHSPFLVGEPSTASNDDSIVETTRTPEMTDTKRRNDDRSGQSETVAKKAKITGRKGKTHDETYNDRLMELQKYARDAQDRVLDILADVNAKVMEFFSEVNEESSSE